jgi:ribosomal protein S12 methylthiotransferase accessory factor YcaO
LSSSFLKLKSAKKCVTKDGNTLARIRSANDTIAQIIPICKKIFVTRISDITYLDKLYIPNFSVILPGTEDSIWVYSGKGITRADARASGLMEAIERFCSLPSIYSKGFIQGNYIELTKSYDKVLHPDELVEPVSEAYDDKKSKMEFIMGYDIINNEPVLVPAQLALSKYLVRHPFRDVFPKSHTNGLASGNVLEEAVFHALCEVIERDASSIADLCASSVPYNILEAVGDSLKKMKNGGYRITQICAQDKFVDDSTIYPEVDICGIANEFEPIKYLVKRFEAAGISLLIKDITQKDIGIPTFVASSIEWITHDYGYFAKGFGTHTDSRIALVRAITELSQTRAVNIQGARDDLKKIQYRQDDEIYNRKWPFMRVSAGLAFKNNTGNKNAVEFHEIGSQVNKDILDDIHLILERLRRAKLNRAIIVDLTNPKIGIPVVRAIVPGLETFEITNSVMGRRARASFKALSFS